MIFAIVLLCHRIINTGQYIRVEKNGRRHDIILTREGLNVLKFLYTDETLDQ
jgi:predicted transcriptional regulator